MKYREPFVPRWDRAWRRIDKRMSWYEETMEIDHPKYKRYYQHYRKLFDVLDRYYKATATGGETC